LRRRCLIAGGLTTLGLACLPAAKGIAENACEPRAAPEQRKPQRAVSLKIVEAQVAHCKTAEDCPRDVRALYDLTRIEGFVVDPENRDIVLLGTRVDSEPPLFLDDFLVALRNLHGRYPALGVDEDVLTYPAVSLDPLPETMLRLKELQNELSGATLGPEVDVILSRWRRACLSPQTVRIMGIPRDVRFAQIMVQSDYIVKRVADGDANLHVDRFPSLMDMYVGQALDQIQIGRTAAALSLTRFWFMPGSRTYLSSERSVLIDRCSVQLLQEDQLLTEHGRLVRGAAKNDAASRFACNFSVRYPEIASSDPVYRDLENLYRWMTLARLIIDTNAVERSGFNLGVLIDRFPLHSYSMPRTLPGHSAVGNRDGETKRMRYLVRVPSCGGVELRFEPGSVLSEEGRPDFVAEIRHSTLRSRPMPETASWIISE
jgi:hypothetical protein